MASTVRSDIYVSSLREGSGNVGVRGEFRRQSASKSNGGLMIVAAYALQCGACTPQQPFCDAAGTRAEAEAGGEVRSKVCA